MVVRYIAMGFDVMAGINAGILYMIIIKFKIKPTVVIAIERYSHITHEIRVLFERKR